MKIRICVLKRTGDIKARFGQSRNFIFLFVDVVRNQSLIFMRCKSNHYPIIDPIIDPGMIGSTHVAFTIFVGAPRSSHRNAHCDRITGRGWKIDIVEIDIWEEASCPTHCISKHNISNGGSLDITHPTVGNQWKKFCAKTSHCETRTAISGSICQI